MKPAAKGVVLPATCFMMEHPTRAADLKTIALICHCQADFPSYIELPVERPARVYLTINLKLAQRLGIEINPAILTRAEEVIE